MARVAIFGDICIDKYPQQNLKFLGGCAFNVAVTFHELKEDFTLISLIGEDLFTNSIEDCINHLKIDSFLFRVPLSNQEIEINIDEDGERSFANYCADILSTQPSFEFNDFDFVISPYFEEIRLLIKSSFETPSHRVFLDLQDASNIDESEFVYLCERASYINIGNEVISHDLLLKCSQNCIITVTLGERGSRFYYQEQFEEVGACEVSTVVDSTGAGDRFFGFVAHGLIKSKLDINNSELHKLVGEANIYASKIVKFIGPNSILFMLA